MKRVLLWGLGTLLVGLGIYWFTRNETPPIALPEQSIQKSLDTRFPLVTDFEGNGVTFADPFVDLLGGSSRVAFSIAVSVATRSGGSVSASARLSGAVRFVAEDRRIVLDSVEVDELKLARGPASKEIEPGALRFVLVRDVCMRLAGLPLHELDEADWPNASRLVVESAAVSEDELLVTLRPAPE